MSIDPGYFGLLDFTGLPVGIPPVSTYGHGSKVGGKPQSIIVRMLIEQERQRYLDSVYVKQRQYTLISEFARMRVNSEITRRQRLISQSTFTVLLSEL